MDKPKIVAPKVTGQCPVGVGVDLVQIDAFAQQLSEPGTSFSQRAFSPRELRQAQARVRARGAEPNWQELAPHLAARWAAKEAFVKAWSTALVELKGAAAPQPLSLESFNWDQVEVLLDEQLRPQLALRGQVAQAVSQSVGEPSWLVSLSHEGNWASAVVIAALTA